MNAGNLLLGIYLILVGVAHFGVAIPGILMGIIAILAGIAVIAGPLIPWTRS